MTHVNARLSKIAHYGGRAEAIGDPGDSAGFNFVGGGWILRNRLPAAEDSMLGSFLLRDPRDLIAGLLAVEWRVIAPVERDGALCLDVLGTPDALPRGLCDFQTPGSYRLERGTSERWFDAVVGPQGWKRWLWPPERLLWSARRSDDGFDIAAAGVDWPATVFFGVRPCDLAAIARQAEVFARAGDTTYGDRLTATRIVAVNCGRSAETCFCASMGTGPRASDGFDLALTELDEGIVVDVGSSEGMELLGSLGLPRAPPEMCRAARCRVDNAAETQSRAMPPDVAACLDSAAESPRWAEIADRCLHCANCTLVCPTCFCTDVTDRTDLSGENAERWQRWDSCFSPDFSYLHGGAVRRSVAARYRQWMTHKLSGWYEQFGASGCTGCGRCITWCPAGIDLVTEARAFAEEG